MRSERPRFGEGLRLGRLALLMAVGLATLLFAAFLPSRGQSVSKADTPEKVAALLDCLAQARFQDESLGVFGDLRMGPLIRGHDTLRLLVAKDATETKIMKMVVEARRDYVIGFFRCAHVPAKFQRERETVMNERSTQTLGAKSKLTPYKADSGRDFEALSGDTYPRMRWLIIHHPTGGKNDSETFDLVTTQSLSALRTGQDLGKIYKNALPRLLKGQGADAKYDRWQVFLRPVKAAKSSCLTCHTTAKQNDTLGVLAYLVHSTVNPADTSKKIDVSNKKIDVSKETDAP